MANQKGKETNEELKRFLRLAISQAINPETLKTPTANELSQRSNDKLSLGEVQALLRGEFPTFAKYRIKLEGIADALELSERQKEALFAKAGFAYQPQPVIGNLDELIGILHDIHLPASIRTPLWDYVAFNSSYKSLWSYSDEYIAKLEKGTFGPNLLRIIFDPDFADRTVPIGESWKSGVVETFRALSFPFIATQRYQEIIKCAFEFKEFRVLWSLSSAYDNRQPNLYRQATNHLVHPNLGRITTLSLRIPQFMYRHT